MVDYIQQYEESFARVTATSLCDRFLDGFYRRFITSDPMVAEKFAGTDMAHQKQMLHESLAEMADFALKRASNPYIVTLSRVHGIRGRNIPVHLYDLWLDCLVDTVLEIDPQASESVALAWRVVMAPGIEFMKFYRSR